MDKEASLNSLDENKNDFDMKLLKNLFKTDISDDELKNMLDTSFEIADSADEQADVGKRSIFGKSLKGAFEAVKLNTIFKKCLETKDFAELKNFIQYDANSAVGRDLEEDNATDKAAKRTPEDAKKKAHTVAKLVSSAIKDGASDKKLLDLVNTIVDVEPKLGLWGATVGKITKDINSREDIPPSLKNYLGKNISDYVSSFGKAPSAFKKNDNIPMKQYENEGM